jgi:chromosome segregation protein
MPRSTGLDEVTPLIDWARFALAEQRGRPEVAKEQSTRARRASPVRLPARHPGREAQPVRAQVEAAAAEAERLERGASPSPRTPWLDATRR